MPVWHEMSVTSSLYEHVLKYASKEKGQLLKRWVSCGENLASCEAAIRAAKTAGLEGRGKKRLISVKDMRAAPYNFSAFL